MLAIDYDAGYIARSDPGKEVRIATLRLAVGRKENADVIETAVRDRSWEYKRRIARNQEVVTRIILQFHGVARALDESDHGTANRVAWLRANDVDVADVAVDGASGIGDGAGLHRRIRLGEDGNGVGRAAKKGGGEGEINVTGAADDKIVRRIVLQREPF